MTKKRSIDIDAIKAMRDAGKTWADIAKALNWSLPWLMRRVREEGLEQAVQPLPVIASASAPAAAKKQTLREQIGELARLGATLEQVSILTGKAESDIIKAIKSDWTAYSQRARLEAQLDIARAVYSRALAGDKAAINRFSRGLF